MIREADVDGDGFINYDGACPRRDAAGLAHGWPSAVQPPTRLATGVASRLVPLPTHPSIFLLVAVCIPPSPGLQSSLT